MTPVIGCRELRSPARPINAPGFGTEAMVKAGDRSAASLVRGRRATAQQWNAGR